MMKTETMTSTTEPNNPSIVIAVMGVTGSGKSSFIEKVSGLDTGVGHSLKSQTQKITGYTFTRNGVNITLVDTPGFNDTYKTDTEVLLELAKWLEVTYRAHVQLTGIIYCHRILDVRMDGGAMRNLRMFRKLCGTDPMKNVVMASTFWGIIPDTVAVAHETELSSNPEFWGEMISSGTRTARFLGTVDSGLDILGMFSKMPRVALKLQQELVDEEIPLGATSAGHAVNEELAELTSKYTAEIAKIQQENAEAIAERDIEMQKMLKAEREKIEKQLRRVTNDQERLKAERRDDIRRIEMEWEQKWRLMQLENDQVRANERETYEQRIREEREHAERLNTVDQTSQAGAQQVYASSLNDKSDSGTKLMQAAGAVTMVMLGDPYALPLAVVSIVDFLNSI